jgi:hypothetical protein
MIAFGILMLHVILLEGLPVSGEPGGAALLQANFERDPLKDGWRQGANSGGKFEGEWAAGQGAAGTGGLVVRQGYWESPAVPVRPLDYYRVRFQAKNAAGAYAFAVFVDADGAELAADVCDGVDAAADWQRREFHFRAHASAARAKLRFQPCEGTLAVDDVSLAPADAAGAAAWVKALAAANPPVSYVPPAARWDLLPRTRARLRGGGVLRIVILGDSIANDTASSLFELPLGEAWPKTRIEVIPSVRGGAGCQFYQEEGRVREYVLRFRPDLVIIAGISHGYDAEAIRRVIRQVRAEQGPEILVLTDAVAPEERMREGYLKFTKLPLGQAQENVAQFRARLERVVGEEKVALLDMRDAWNDFVRQSPPPLAWYMRDAIHANSRGKQVLGEILRRYLGPDAGADAHLIPHPAPVTL